MANFFFLLAALVAAFVGLAIVLVAWGVLRSRNAAPAESPRGRLITLAARAASDESGQGLVALLDALDLGDADGAIKASWLQHRPVNGNEGMLVRISWDGNEWRKIYPYAELEARLSPLVQGSGSAARLLADVRAALSSSPPPGRS